MLNVYKALKEFSKNIKPVRKDSDNDYFESRYASLNAVINAVEVPLEKAGLFVSQMVHTDKLVTSIVHLASGEFLVSEYPLVTNLDPQKFASSLSYARRYSLVTCLGLMVEDDDGNAASGKQPNQKQGKPVIKEVHNFNTFNETKIKPTKGDDL